jgi:16S rRNA (guanine527-N7)-methyltransferase
VATAPAVAARLDELAARHDLPAAARAQLAVLLEHLADEHAPTTVRDPHAGVDVHVADSLSGLHLLPDTGTVADLGSGAGLPGLVIAAARPPLRVMLVETVRRKTEFIAGAAEAMGLGNAEAVWSRAEEWRTGHEACEVVTCRALAALGVLCEYAAPLLRIGGRMIAWKGEVEPAEARDAAAAADVLGLRLVAREEVQPFPGSRQRTLWVYEKTRETPPQYPRRPGMATKRPISATPS